MPPSAIETLVNCEATVNGIWHSLKGLTGVTAKCIARNVSLNDPARATHGIKMGGIVIIAAAHCPQVAKWLKTAEWSKAPGNPVLSLEPTCQSEEAVLWEKLNAFCKKIIPCISDPQSSNISSVSLEQNSVVLKLRVGSFEPREFSKRLSLNNGGGTCSAFRDLRSFLAQEFSKTSLDWNQENCSFIFKTKGT